SDYRKPGPGMLLEGARDLRIDLSRSWMVGDVWKDVVAGNSAGCRTILIQEPGLLTETTDDIPAFLLERQAGGPLSSEDAPRPADPADLLRAEALRTPTFTVSGILEAANQILRTDSRLPNDQVIALP